MSRIKSGAWIQWLAAAVFACAALSPAAFAQPAAEGESLKEVRVAADRFLRGEPVPAWVDELRTIPETGDKSPLVVRLADSQFMAEGEPRVYSRRVWAINAASGLDRLGNYAIGFQSGYQRVRLHTLRIHRQGQVLDQVMSASIRFLQREAGLEEGLYNGETTASILVNDLRVGDSLEIAYTLEGANPVMGRRYLDAASWDQPFPIELRRVALLYPPARPVQWKLMGDLRTSIAPPVQSMAGPLRKLYWEEKSIAATVYEQWSPYSFQADRFLQFSEFASWAEVSQWALDLFRPPATPSPALQQLADRIGRQGTPQERVSRALGWVQSEIRYFSVSLGESSHRPHPPEETLARRYGDCKDKTFLLIGLLRGLGVQAEPVLLSSKARTGVRRQQPSPYAFDHAIVHVRLDGRSYFLDPTLQGQTGRLDRLGQIHEGAEVLVVRADTTDFETIQTPNIADITKDELRERISLPRFGGPGRIEVRHTWSGAAAEARRRAVASWPRDQFEKMLMEPYEARYPGITRTKDSVIDDDTLNNELTLSSFYESPKIAINRGTDWGVRYASANLQGMLQMPPSAQRSQPFAISTVVPRTHQYFVEVEFPPEVTVVSDPVSRTVRDPAFEYTAALSFRGNRATAALSLQVQALQVDAARVPDYMDALRRTDEAARPVFVVGRNEIRSASTGPRSLQQTLRERVQDRVNRITAAVDSGKISGDDLAEALSERANARTDLGETAEALKDAQQAIKLSPNLPVAYQSRASALFSQGEFARSAADYSRAITLGGGSFMAHYRRGQSRYYGGQLVQALDDFDKAMAAKDADEEGSLYAELWHAWTQKRLGLTANASRLSAASAAAKGEWPRPALALLHDKASVQDVLRSLDTRKGDERTMALAEAYFYIGKHFLLRGDKTLAAEYFRRTREQGVIVYVEHVAAGIELSILGERP